MRTFGLFLCLLGSVWSCKQSNSASATVTVEETVSRRQLIRSGRRSPAWRVVYCGATPQANAQYQQQLEPLRKRAPFDKEIELCACDSLSATALSDRPLMLIGSRIPEGWTATIRQEVPFDRAPGVFRFAGTYYADAQDLIKFNYIPSPWNPKQPLHLWQANEDSVLLAHLADRYAVDWDILFWSSWGYELLQKGQTKLLGYLDERDWSIDPSRQFSFELRADLLAEGPHARYWSWDGAQPNEFEALQASFEHLVDTVQAFLGSAAPTKAAVDWYFYPSVERIGLRRRDMRRAQVADEGRSIHLVQNTHFRGADTEMPARALLRQWLGATNQAVLEEGLSLWFSRSLGERDYTYWASRLYHSDNWIPLEELLNPEQFAVASELVRAPIAATLVDFLLQQLGKAAFLRSYRTGQLPSMTEWSAEWEAYLAALPREEQTTIQTNASNNQRFRKGFTFAHEGYRVFNGYGGAQAAQSLDSMAFMQVNAVAIVPYSFMRSANQVRTIPIARQAGSENDEAVLYTHFSVQDRGWYSLLKPQIWLRGAWPGAIEFNTQAEWDHFFDCYYRWIRHYAMLAEVYHFEAFCIGTELVKATLGHEAKWRRMIQQVRGIYRGTLTYAANWGEEFEQLAFWDAFDVIGLNGYYPLAEADSVSDSALLAGTRAIMSMATETAQRTGKPVWFTEIGYRSIEAPWQHPHAEAGDRKASNEDQARAYAAFLEAVQESPEVRGFFWWKWPSYLEYSRPGDRGYSPAGKPAAEVLRAF